MLDLEIPGWSPLHLRYLVIDVNATLTSDGAILDGVDERLREIRTSLDIRLLSADTFGRLDALSAQLSRVK
jgi:soluble P-type ATPase